MPRGIYPRSLITREKMRKRMIGNKCNFGKGETEYIHSDGYILKLVRNHPYSHNDFVYAHRLVVEKEIGRYLLPSEEVHHLGTKTENYSHKLMAFINHSAHLKFEKGKELKPEEIIFDGRKLTAR